MATAGEQPTARQTDQFGCLLLDMSKIWVFSISLYVTQTQEWAVFASTVGDSLRWSFWTHSYTNPSLST